MVSALLESLESAYGGGKIVPTGMGSFLPFVNQSTADTCLVFVFPPRQTKGTGPMFISQQVLSFAGVCTPNVIV